MILFIISFPDIHCLLMEIHFLLFFGFAAVATTASLNRTKNNLRDSRAVIWPHNDAGYDPYHNVEYELPAGIKPLNSGKRPPANDIASSPKFHKGLENKDVVRKKRSTASVWDDAEFDMSVGSSTDGAADLGDHYDFTVTLNLPTLAESSPLNIELFSSNPEDGTSSLHICSPTINKAEQVS